MKTNEEILERLKESISLNNYGVIRQLMKNRKNFHFFSERVKKPKNSYFEFREAPAVWSDQYSINPFTNVDGFNFFEVLVDVRLKGTINEYNTKGITFFTEPIEIDLTIRAYVQEDGWVGMDNIHLMNAEQKALLKFHQQYEAEFKKIGVKTIFETQYQGAEAFVFFMRICKNVNNENPIMVKGTSLDYFHEIGEAQRNVMYSVCCANMWGRYISHFSDNFYRTEGGKVYPHSDVLRRKIHFLFGGRY